MTIASTLLRGLRRERLQALRIERRVLDARIAETRREILMLRRLARTSRRTA